MPPEDTPTQGPNLQRVKAILQSIRDETATLGDVGPVPASSVTAQTMVVMGSVNVYQGCGDSCRSRDAHPDLPPLRDRFAG